MDFLPLTPEEARALGALVEKALTTPEYYPLTLNALANACNQLSNRDPVVAYDEATVLRAVEALRDRKLGFVFHGAGSRVVKYGHRLAEALELDAAGLAVLCVLLLRGPQTAGEIRGRTGRLHAFADLGEVEAALDALAAHASGPLVTKLPRQAGCKESRYAHLLAGPVAAAAPAAPETLDAPPPRAAASTDRVSQLETEVASLRHELTELRQQFTDFRRQLE